MVKMKETATNTRHKYLLIQLGVCSLGDFFFWLACGREDRWVYSQFVSDTNSMGNLHWSLRKETEHLWECPQCSAATSSFMHSFITCLYSFLFVFWLPQFSVFVFLFFNTIDEIWLSQPLTASGWSPGQQNQVSVWSLLFDLTTFWCCHTQLQPVDRNPVKMHTHLTEISFIFVAGNWSKREWMSRMPGWKGHCRYKVRNALGLCFKCSKRGRTRRGFKKWWWIGNPQELYVNRSVARYKQYVNSHTQKTTKWIVNPHRTSAICRSMLRDTLRVGSEGLWTCVVCDEDYLTI